MMTTSSRPRWRRACWTGLPLAVAVIAGAAEAQTRFEWPDLAVNLDRYADTEECLAAVVRLREGAEAAGAWSDTMPLSPAEARTPLPGQVVETAKVCAARLGAESDSLRDFAARLHLYLLAGWDDRARALAERRLAAVAPKAERERGAVLDTLVRAYLGYPLVGVPELAVKPVRLTEAAPLAMELADAAAVPGPTRVEALYLLMSGAEAVGDTALARRAAEHVVAAGATVTPAERRETRGKRVPFLVFAALDLLAERELYDSLMKGTAPFVALQRANWAKASGEPPEGLRFPIGEKAPRIEGDFWFGRRDTTTTRPTSGRPALVVFITHDICELSRCLQPYAAIRRLAQRFPELEVTIVSRTLGHVSKMKPPEPAEEAAILGRHWLEARNLPGALSVTATDFWRLPDPDLRRIDRKTANERNYAFGRQAFLYQIPGFLIDREGTVVHVADMTARRDEARVGRLLEILQTRQTATLDR